MSVLILHNGNLLVKPWFRSRLNNSIVMPCIADSWNLGSQEMLGLDSKIQYATTNSNICTDITCADNMSAMSVVKLKKVFDLVKIVTDYQTDIENLDSAWNLTQYDQTQWLRASTYGLALCDQLIFWNKLNFASTQTAAPVIFTTGRSGTHVLKEVSGVKDFYHHNTINIGANFQRLIDAEFVGTVVRKSFLNFLLSKEIAKQRQLLLTTANSLQETKHLVSNWDSIHIDQHACDQTLTDFVNYVDILLGLFYFYNKSINFSFLEDLSEHYDSIGFVKNPYHAPDLCANFEEVSAWCDEIYQPIYENILKKLQLLFGSNYYKHV